MQKFLKIPNPCAGMVYSSTVHKIKGDFDYSSFQHVGAECEIAIQLGDGLPATSIPYDRSSVASAVDLVMAGIEIVDDRWIDYQSMDVPTLIADDFFGAGCVLGKPIKDWQQLDLTSLEGRMLINGIEVGQGTGFDIMGHPFEALAWLANTAVQHSMPLQSGEFIFLGSIVETKWLKRGDFVEVIIENLGEVKAQFV